MILIVAQSNDATVDFVRERLINNGFEFAQLNTDELQYEGTISGDPIQGEWVLRTKDQELILNSVSSVWLREIHDPSFDTYDPEISRYVTREWSLCLKWWLDSIPETMIVDPDWKVSRASNKFLQLSVASRLGLTIPPTLVTTNVSDFKNFFERNDGTVVKTLGGFGSFLTDSRHKAVFTNKVSVQDLICGETLKYAPVMFQREVKKKYEVRATLVGRKMFSCRIDSQCSERTKIDWRRYDFDNVPHSPIELPSQIEDKLRKLAYFFSITFASFDMAVTSEGEFVFFEMNPNSQWVWIERLTELPITDALIELLTEKRQQKPPRDKTGMGSGLAF